MANHRKTETAAKLKKFYSTMSNAIKLAELEEGIPSYEWGYTCGQSYEQEKDFYEKYVLKYINYNKIGEMDTNDPRKIFLEENSYGTKGFYAYLNDGSMFFSGECADNVAYDVNGDKGPNEFGRDIFMFFILSSTDGVYADPIIDSIPHFNTILHNTIPWDDGLKNYTREKSLQQCKTDRTWGYCTHLIELDGWEIKDDYPYKL